MTDFPIPHILGIIGLIIGSIAYFALIRRRAGDRSEAASEHALQESGLRGLVRVMLAESLGAAQRSGVTASYGGGAPVERDQSDESARGASTRSTNRRRPR